MNQIIFYACLMVTTVITSCGIKTRLSQTELKWMNVYKEGDTLIFKSEKEEFDTSYIIKKEVYYPSYNPVEVHDKYLPQWGVVWYKNKRLEYHPEGSRLISLIKKDPKGRTSLTIDFLYSKILASNIASGELKKYKRGDIYEFNTYHPKALSSEPKRIFWDENYGIIKYITHDNIVWERINISR